MSRRRIVALAALALALAAPGAAWGQDAQTGSPPQRIDLTVTSAPPAPSNEEQCRRDSEAAVVSGEIVVCGTRPREDQRITSREEAQNRYAEATKGGSTPDVAGAGIFRGPPTFSGICVPGIFNCPKAAAVFVDVAALPKAPPGSDADRIARGLAPLGEDGTGGQRSLSAQERAELGLPDPVTPPAAAAPAVPQ
ncbi:hypothetical protein [Qipengyuania sediminis]|uniref:hypothetical protein n=1 Tax=Qipengyuania sediminis TaxID=1532023 RepID=UPI001059AF06|nr:hypothetical protein [Qipengyuania sediminis]